MQQLRAGATMQILRHENQLLADRNKLVVEENRKLIRELEKNYSSGKDQELHVDNIINNQTVLKKYLSQLKGNQFMEIQAIFDTLIKSNSCQYVIKCLLQILQNLLKLIISQQQVYNYSCLQKKVNTQKLKSKHLIHFVKEPNNINTKINQQMQFVEQAYQKIIQNVKRPSVSITSLYQIYETVEQLSYLKNNCTKHRNKINKLQRQFQLHGDICDGLPQVYRTWQDLQVKENNLRKNLVDRTNQLINK